jgi:hypothetical protein
MDTKVSVSDFVRAGCWGGWQLCSSFFGALEMRSGAVKHSAGPCAFVGDDSAEIGGLGFCRSGERKNSDPGIQSLPAVET